MRRVLVLSFSHLKRDPRVNRQIRWLADSWQVTAAGLSDPETGVRFVPVAPRHHANLVGKVQRGLRFLARRHEANYWHMATPAYAALHADPHDLIVANDPDTLPLAVRLAQEWQAKLVYDAHEYAPSEFADQWRWRLLHGPYATYLCRRYMPHADATLTVCEGLADAYEALVGRKPTVVTNAPDFQPELQPIPYDPAKPIRLVHHGAANPSRRIDTMIDIAKGLGERFETSFILMGDEAYKTQLRERAAHHPRVHFRDPVPMRELPAYLNQFDIGLSWFAPTNLSLLHALPNKFFEFFQARLGVAIGPSPEMVRIVQATGAGLIADSFAPQALIAKLNQLSPADVNRFKQAAHTHAEAQSATPNRQRFLSVCDRVSEVAQREAD